MLKIACSLATAAALTGCALTPAVESDSRAHVHVATGDTAEAARESAAQFCLRLDRYAYPQAQSIADRGAYRLHRLQFTCEGSGANLYRGGI